MTREQALGNDEFSVRWTGQLVPPVTGKYELTVTGDDGFRLDVAGQRVLDEWTPTPRARARTAMLDFEAGKAYDVKLEYFENIRDAEVRLNWRQPGAKDPYEEALEAARAADVVIFAGGLNGEVEGEEMPVIYPGFAGGDRTEIALPTTQQKLLEDLHATGKPVVLVLMTGSALAVEWAKANLPAVLVAWYPGQQGGNAIADVLFGKVNPSGRLPVTFYKSVGDLPPFADYSMKNRTYKYFTGEPLYAFGHGLSYTRFDYTGIRIAPASGAASEAFDVSFDVQNTGTRAGHEVPQLYARALDAGRPMPLRELRGFTRIHLAPGARQRVSFRVTKQDLAYYDEAAKRFVTAPGEYEMAAGRSSADLPVSARVRVP
jgi:beta-glucosidase